MERLPFDPDRINAPASGKDTADRPLAVSAVSGLIKDALSRAFPTSLRVVGQLGNLSARHHWYFSLKDDDAVISCVAWASTVRKFTYRPEDGDEIIVTGTISHYAPQGRTQLYVTRIEPVGTGSLHQQYQRLCEELRREGYFDEGRKRPLPTFPRRVAVISSASGAAVHDVVATAEQRCRAVALVLADTRVQGDGAKDDVVRAIGRVNAQRDALGIDAIILTRGGGSLEDLWTFNERAVADAVYRSELPIVAAIGHESDTTIAELVADRRASTPTQAAMVLLPSAEELMQQVVHLGDRLRTLISREIERADARLRRLVDRPVFARPEAWLVPLRERLDGRGRELRGAHAAFVMGRRSRLEALARRLADRAAPVEAERGRLQAQQLRLRNALRRRLDAAGARIDRAEAALTLLDPSKVLERGFTYTTGPDGALVRAADDVKAGDRLTTHLADGTVQSTVDGPTGGDAPQLDLFGGGG